MWQQYLNALPNKARRAVFYLREYLFPFGCPLCGGALACGETWHGLCAACQAALERDLGESRTEEAPPANACDCCGKPLISEHVRCLSCRAGEERAFDGVKVLFPYTGKYRKLLSAYKFGKNLALGNYLAGLITEAAGSFAVVPKAGSARGAGIVAGTGIVPVPPRPGKIRKSGWDQVEYLARLLEKRFRGKGGFKVDRCLKRLPSKSQKELDKKSRLTNLKGRIVPVRQAPKTAIVLDDVMTTGSTLDVCAAALKQAGSERVYGLCLFYD